MTSRKKQTKNYFFPGSVLWYGNMRLYVGEPRLIQCSMFKLRTRRENRNPARHFGVNLQCVLPAAAGSVYVAIPVQKWFTFPDATILLCHKILYYCTIHLQSAHVTTPSTHLLN